MTEDGLYTAGLDCLRAIFENRAAERRESYLFVFLKPFNEAAFVGVTKGAYPWAVHDAFLARNEGSALAMALDLDRPFDEQVPKEVQAYTTLEGLCMRPLVNIPDRAGTNAHTDAQKRLRRICSAPDLRIIK